LQDFLANPAVQGGVAPFLAALLIAVALSPVRLGGLAVIAAFLVCVHLASGIQFSPLTATRKVVLLSIAAACIGPLVDLAFRPTRIGALLLALAAAAAGVWAFWPVLGQKPVAEAWLLGAVTVVAAAFMVGFTQLRLSSDAVRVGAAGLGAGLGAGIGAILGASLSYGFLGISLAAGAGAFLLPQMVRGRKAHAGATFALPAMLTAALVASGAMILAQFPWYSVLTLALVPVAVTIPLPPRAPVALQAVVASLSASAVAAVACGLAYAASRN
jgi:hypothetical protein